MLKLTSRKIKNSSKTLEKNGKRDSDDQMIGIFKRTKINHEVKPIGIWILSLLSIKKTKLNTGKKEKT